MRSTTILFLLVTFVYSNYAEEKIPFEIERIQDAKQRKIDEIEEQYQAALRKQKDVYIKRKDFESAKLIDEMLIKQIDEDKGESNQELFDLLSKKISIISTLGTEDIPQPRITVNIDKEEVFQSTITGCHILSFSLNGLESKQHFKHVYGDLKKEKEMLDQLLAHIEDIPDERMIAICVCSAFNPFLRGNIKEASSKIGGRTAEVEYLQPYVCFGYKGLKRGKAIEVVGKPAKKEPPKFMPAIWVQKEEEKSASQ